MKKISIVIFAITFVIASCSDEAIQQNPLTQKQRMSRLDELMKTPRSSVEIEKFVTGELGGRRSALKSDNRVGSNLRLPTGGSDGCKLELIGNYVFSDGSWCSVYQWTNCSGGCSSYVETSWWNADYTHAGYTRVCNDA